MAHGDGCLVVSGNTVADAKRRARDLASLAPWYPTGTPQARTEEGDCRMKELTDKQRAVLNFIKGYVAEKKYPPTIGEIGEEFGLASRSTVFSHVHALERKGYLEIDGGPRTLRVVEP